MPIILFSDATETNEIVCACGIFAHGDLETKLGYDVICPKMWEADDQWGLTDLTEDGVYDVLIQHKSEQIPAKLFYWKSKYGGHRGLACLESDAEHMEDARKKFQIRAPHL